MLNRLNLFLVIALLTVIALLMLARVDHSRPNYQVIIGDDMTYSPAYASFEVNDQFANGRTMQSPVPGTIARGNLPLHFEATPADAIRAGEELVNPFDRSTKAGVASIKRGQVVFQNFCVACHGGDGAGNGLVAKKGFPPPPSLLTGKTLAMKDGQLLHILTYGQNSMPDFAAQLPPDRRWDVINYIRSLQQQAKPPAPATPATTEPTAPVEADTESKP